MTQYALRRLLWLPVTLLAVSFLTFTIARFGPGDPVRVAAGQHADPKVLEQIRADRGLDLPLPQQYVRWLSKAIQGDFGESYQQRGFTVSELIFPRMWVSAQLGLIVIVLQFVLGVPLGLVAARYAGSWIDPVIISTLLFVQSIPILVVIPPILWLFALEWGVLPTGGWDGLIDILWIQGVIAIPIPDPHLWIPVSVMTLPGLAGVARLVRVSALDVQVEDYVRTARAKGLAESAVQFRHVFPNSLLPIVTVIGMSLVGVLEGAFFVETMLGIPGIGRFAFESVGSRDYDSIMALTVVLAGAFVVFNLLAELLYARIDPRIRLGAGTRR
ncbi:MAG: ABC transporter permease [Dehalococcoidia bacterium]|nr:ABC transporter permease [Dehalococcoidia bacterium]